MDLISANTVIVTAIVAAGGALVAYQAGACTKKSTKYV